MGNAGFERGFAKMFLELKPNFFGRRQGRRIRKAKSALLETFLPKVTLDTQNPLHFGISPEKVYLEIGFGDGGHLAAQSSNNPNIAFIGAEVFKNGIANLLTLMTGVTEGEDIVEDIKLLPTRTDNVRVYSDDMRCLFPLIPDASIDMVFLLFPDPWPKKRHADRRFVNKDNLQQIARVLKKGGILRVATDHKVYKAWTLRQLHEDTNFVWTAMCGNDWKFEPSGWVQTKYQRKAIREGRKAVFLDFAKI